MLIFDEGNTLYLVSSVLELHYFANSIITFSTTKGYRYLHVDKK